MNETKLEKIKKHFKGKKWSEMTPLELEELYETEKGTWKILFVGFAGFWIFSIIVDDLQSVSMMGTGWLLAMFFSMIIIQSLVINDIGNEIRFKKLEEKIEPKD